MDECQKCGILVGEMQFHTYDECRKQRRVNEKNQGRSYCKWCDSPDPAFHKFGCPRYNLLKN